MKTLKIKIAKRVSALMLALFLSLTGFSQAHVTMSLKNITSTKSTIQYDLYIVNDGQTNLKLSACSYGVNFNPLIINNGKLTYTQVKLNKEVTLQGLSAFSLASTQVGEIVQARMTSTPTQFANAIQLPRNQVIKIGRFMIVNTEEWTPNSNPLFALEESKILGLTTTLIVGYIDEGHELVAFTPSLKTVTTLVEKSSLLNITEGNKRSVASSNEESLIIYPNPIMNELNIDLFVSDQVKLIINITDMNGRIVKQIQTNLVEGANKISIDLTELYTGVYTINITDGKDLNYTEKFVKN